MIMAKTKTTPRQPIVSANANPRVLAARVATTCSTPHCLQPIRACCPPAYLTQDQSGALSRSHMFAIGAAKATKPADDSGDDDDDNDKEEVRSVGKKGNDGGDDK